MEQEGGFGKAVYSKVELGGEYGKLEAIKETAAKYAALGCELHGKMEDFLVGMAQRFKGDTVDFTSPQASPVIIVDTEGNISILKKIEVGYYNAPYPIITVREGDLDLRLVLNDIPILQQIDVAKTVLEHAWKHRELLKTEEVGEK